MPAEHYFYQCSFCKSVYQTTYSLSFTIKCPSCKFITNNPGSTTGELHKISEIAQPDLPKSTKDMPIPTSILQTLITETIQGPIFKEFLTGLLNTAKQYLDIGTRVDTVEKQLNILQHNLQLMLEARHKLEQPNSTSVTHTEEHLNGMKKFLATNQTEKL